MHDVNEVNAVNDKGTALKWMERLCLLGGVRAGNIFCVDACGRKRCGARYFATENYVDGLYLVAVGVVVYVSIDSILFVNKIVENIVVFHNAVAELDARHRFDDVACGKR